MYEDTDRFENWFITSLQTSITDTTNSFRLNKALNVNQCRLVIDPYDESLREIVQVTSVDGDLVYVNRGDDHTDPQYHQEGAIVALHVFAADLNDLYADWDKFQTELQEAIDDANDAALAANNAASAAEDATDLANAATLAANNAADSATSAASSATMAAGLANTATTNANNAADSANSAANDANDAADAAELIVADYEAYADSIVDTAIESYILDEDDMASDSDTKVPSQQSVKAYVDGRTNSVKCAFKLAHGANDQNPTGGAYWKLRWDTLRYDIGSNITGTTTTRKFIVPVDGVYHFDAAYITESGAELVQLALFRNGSMAARAGNINFNSTTSNFASWYQGWLNCDLLLSAGDEIEAYVTVDDSNSGQGYGVNYNWWSGHLVVETT